MKRFLISTVAAAVLTLVVTAESRAVDIPVSGTIYGAGDVVDPGPDLFFTPSLHVISRPWFVAYELTTGGFGPEILVSSALFVDLNAGKGELFGEVEWADPEIEGSGFRGPFSGKLTNAYAPVLAQFDGYWVLHGYGIYQGMTATIHNYGPFVGVQAYEGVIHVPDGN
jgi:hypothetical protein